MSRPDPAISAVVVHYRGGDLIGRCVESCLETGRFLEVVVVDNEGVGERLRERFVDRRVRVLQMRGNAGYGRAANAGLEAAAGDSAIVLNQDTLPTVGAIEGLVEAGAAARAWVVGPRLVGPDGVEPPPKPGFPPPLAWSPPPDDPAGEGWRCVPWVSGAAMLLTPGHLDLRFDPRLHMYAEDEELCYRVWRDGGRVALAERARLHHVGGTASGTRWGRPSITARTLANRARMVRWHGGWGALPAYLGRDVAARAARRARRG